MNRPTFPLLATTAHCGARGMTLGSVARELLQTGPSPQLPAEAKLR